MTTTYYQCDNERVRELGMDARYVAKHMGYTTVRCGLFSMNCTKIHIVPAVVGPERRAFDIIFRTYVNVSVSRETLVYNLDRFMINPDRYLVNFMGEGPFKFTIFKSNHPLDAPNNLIKSFYRGQDLDIWGNILVVKTDQNGLVCPVVASDSFFIQRLVVETFSCVPDAFPPSEDSDGMDNDTDEV